MNRALLSFFLILSIAASTVSGFSVAVGGVNGGKDLIVMEIVVVRVGHYKYDQDDS